MKAKKETPGKWKEGGRGRRPLDPNDPVERINVTLPRSHGEALRKLARERGWSMGYLIIHALQAFMKAEQGGKLK
jgi:hypothetical protein